MKRVSIVIPVYNEEGVIGKVLDGIGEMMKRKKKDYEILVVNDGSVDKTEEEVKKRRVKVISNPYRRGYGGALKTGIQRARGEYLIFFDGDGQHNPYDIPRISQELGKYDMVVGARREQSHLPLYKRLSKALLCRVADYLAQTRIPDLNSGLRGVKKEVVMRFMHLLPNTFSFTTTITLALIKDGYSVKYLPIETKRRVGRGTMSYLRDGFGTLLLILRTIVLFDPLRIFLPVSFLLFLVGLGMGLFGVILYQNLSKSALLLLLSGISVFFFGLLADQVSHIRREL